MTNLNRLTRAIVCLVFVCSSIMATAQYKPLKIGEVVPDFLINNVSNYPKTSLRLSEFRGKYVILDFWDHNCASCLEAFPKMDSLQGLFAKDLQIVTVNPRTSLATTNLFKRLKNLHLPKMPFVNSDTALKQLFPHVGNPHHIWIDREGKFLFPADNFNLNKDSLQQLITHGTLDVLPKVKTLIIESFFDQRFKTNVRFASYIIRVGENKFSVRPRGIKNGVLENGSIGNLYLSAFTSLTKDKHKLTTPGKLILELDSPLMYFPAKNLKGRELKEWKFQNSYIYQSILPEKSKLNPYAIMIEDLERFFRVRGTLEQRSLKTFVLVRTSVIDKLKTSGGQTKNTLYGATDPKSPLAKSEIRTLANVDYNALTTRIKHLVYANFHMPFEDSTAYVGKIDFSFDADVLDNPTLEKIKSGLRRYDLDLIEKEVVTDVLVLRDLK